MTEGVSAVPASQIFELGDLTLQNGELLPDARLAYGTAGQLNARRDNCVVLPAYFMGSTASYAGLFGQGAAIDTERYFVIVPTLLGNGQSSSPSNCEWVTPERPFPPVTIGDNIRAQARLVFDHLGVEQIRLVGGWSMGALQAYAWAALYPDHVSALLPWCGAAQCWPLNRVFLGGVAAALRADASYRQGAHSCPVNGLHAFAAVYAGWLYSAEFYRDRLFEGLGFASAEQMIASWQAGFVNVEADDLLTMIGTWQDATAENLVPGSDLADVLRLIRARAIVMPCSTDAYFKVEENAIEAALVREAELRVIPSPYGHAAGSFGAFPVETRMLSDAFRELLN